MRQLLSFIAQRVAGGNALSQPSSTAGGGAGEVRGTDPQLGPIRGHAMYHGACFRAARGLQAGIPDRLVRHVRLRVHHLQLCSPLLQEAPAGHADSHAAAAAGPGAASRIDCWAVCVDQHCGAQGHFAAAFEFKNLSTGRIWAGKILRTPRGRRNPRFARFSPPRREPMLIEEFRAGPEAGSAP